VTLLGLIVVLGVIASAMPAPTWVTDQGAYERMTREWFIPGCGDYHCFRVLVPWMIRVLPGPDWLTWKAYAVICEALAATAMARWVVALGFTPKAGRMVMWATALGAGSLYAIFDPYSSDALMHLLGPGLSLLILRSRIGLAGAIAAAGTLAKEFAAIPLYVMAAVRAQQRRYAESRSALAAAAAATLVWTGWQAALRLGLRYETGPTFSANLLSGGFIGFWVTHIGRGLIVKSIASVFAGFWLLWAAGLVWGPAFVRQLALAAAPTILVLCYLQQPDRALWNFAFVVMPAAAVVLDRVSAPLGWALVFAQSLANLRFGAQLPIAPPARFAFTLAAGLAMIAVWQAARGERRRPAGAEGWRPESIS
jgi:hypothetical protein